MILIEDLGNIIYNDVFYDFGAVYVLRRIRSRYGLSPKYYDIILGNTCYVMPRKKHS